MYEMNVSPPSRVPISLLSFFDIFGGRCNNNISDFWEHVLFSCNISFHKTLSAGGCKKMSDSKMAKQGWFVGCWGGQE